MPQIHIDIRRHLRLDEPKQGHEIIKALEDIAPTLDAIYHNISVTDYEDKSGHNVVIVRTALQFPAWRNIIVELMNGKNLENAGLCVDDKYYARDKQQAMDKRRDEGICGISAIGYISSSNGCLYGTEGYSSIKNRIEEARTNLERLLNARR